jgi:hypothetical protein
MKKFLFILALLFILGCGGLKYSTEYKRQFSQDQKELSYTVAFNFLWVADVDSVPITDWLITQQETKRGYKIERTLLVKPAERTEYLLIHSTFVEKDSTYYTFEILDKHTFNYKK